jgi:hypothetical protein
LNSPLVAGELVGFGSHNKSGHPHFVKPIGELEILDGRFQPGIDQLDCQRYCRAFCKIIVNQLFPLTALGFGHPGVAVPRQIHQEPRSLEPVKIDHPGFAGSRACPGQISAPGQGVNQARFADIGPARDCDFRQPLTRKIARRDRTDHKLALSSGTSYICGHRLLGLTERLPAAPGLPSAAGLRPSEPELFLQCVTFSFGRRSGISDTWPSGVGNLSRATCRT